MTETVKELRLLKKQVKLWTATARLYCENADYWRERAEASEYNFNVLCEERNELRARVQELEKRVSA